MAEKISKARKTVEKYLFNSTRNIFLTGAAGTGKTTLIKEYLEKFPNTIICAPTGTAAVNAGGETMHSIFHIPVPAYGASLTKLKPADFKILSAADSVIIDEISMCRADVFSFAIKVLRKAEKIKGSAIRLIVVGDFCQLPPVVPKTESKQLTKYGFHPSGFPFTCSEWRTLSFKVIELTEIFRQDDIEFKEQLNRIKNKDVSCLPYFNSFVTEDYPSNVIRVCGTNSEADTINAEYLDGLEGLPLAYSAKKKGRVSNLDVEPIILLKENAMVMFTVNDDYRHRFSNGTFGIVVSCDKDFVDVELETGGIVRVTPHTYRAYSYKNSGGYLTKNEIGTITQIPLKIAKAITIHKSQGKTFDNMVLTPNIFAPGQLYVALSRVRDSKGLYLTEPIKEEALQTDELVLNFILQGYQFDGEVPKKKTSKPRAVKTTPVTKKSKASTTKIPSKKKTVAKPKKSTSKAKTTSPKKKPVKKTTSKATTKSKTTKVAKKTTPIAKTTSKAKTKPKAKPVTKSKTVSKAKTSSSKAKSK